MLKGRDGVAKLDKPMNIEDADKSIRPAATIFDYKSGAGATSNADVIQVRLPTYKVWVVRRRVSLVEEAVPVEPIEEMVLLNLLRVCRPRPQAMRRVLLHQLLHGSRFIQR
jgi:hypothetical protein